MKRIIILIAVTAALTLCGCNMMAGSGVVMDYDYSNEDFKSVSVSSACALSITEGPEYSVTVTCDDNLQPYIEVVQTGEILSIGLQPYTSYNNITFKAAVVMPDLKSLEAAEASSVKVTGFANGADISLDFHEASTGDISLKTIGNLNVSAYEASRVTISSETAADILTMTCSEASQLNLSECSVSEADIKVTDASEVWINSNGTVRGELSSASVLNCYGSPNLSGLNTSLASSVIFK